MKLDARALLISVSSGSVPGEIAAEDRHDGANVGVMTSDLGPRSRGDQRMCN